MVIYVESEGLVVSMENSYIHNSVLYVDNRSFELTFKQFKAIRVALTQGLPYVAV